MQMSDIFWDYIAAVSYVTGPSLAIGNILI